MPESLLEFTTGCAYADRLTVGQSTIPLLLGLPSICVPDIYQVRLGITTRHFLHQISRGAATWRRLQSRGRGIFNRGPQALRTVRKRRRKEMRWRRSGQPRWESVHGKTIAAARRVGPATVGAAEGAMGWGRHFKIRPPNKDDAFPRE